MKSILRPASGARFSERSPGFVPVVFAASCAALFVISAAGCGLFSDSYAVSVVFPEGSPGIDGFPGPDSWVVSWLDAGGVRSRVVASGDGCALTMPKERPCIVTVRPATAGLPDSWRAKPAGAAWSPRDAPERSVRPSWEDGFAAWYLLRIAEAGIDPASVNIRRFVDAVDRRGEDRPWDLDLERLGEQLADGSLWIYSFRLSDLVSTELPLPEGTWYREYVPAEPLVAGSGGWTGDLGVGLHAFLRAGDGMVAVVDVDGTGNAAILFESPRPSGD